MDKKVMLIGAAAVILAIIVAAGYFMVVYAPNHATPQQVSDIHMKMSASSIGELESIIKGSSEPYARERAVGVYADIASQSGNTKRAMAFLKDVATTEKNDKIRTYAFTNYYWLRDTARISPQTKVETRIIGDIRPGNNITVLFRVTSLRGSTLGAVGMLARPLQDQPEAPAVSGAGRMNIVDANSGIAEKTNVFITPANRIRKPLPANVTVEFPYSVMIKGPGKVVLESLVRVRYDQVDYDTVKKDIFLDVGSTNGNYIIV